MLSLFQRTQLLEQVCSKEIAEFFMQSIPDKKVLETAPGHLHLNQRNLKKWKTLLLQSGRRYFEQYTKGIPDNPSTNDIKNLQNHFEKLVTNTKITEAGSHGREISLSLTWLFLKLIKDFKQRKISS